MISITSIYGKDALPTHEYVGWLKTKEGQAFYRSFAEKEYGTCSSTSLIVSIQRLTDFVHSFNSQTMREDCFNGNIPLFKGEWEVGKERLLGNKFRKVFWGSPNKRDIIKIYPDDMSIYINGKRVEAKTLNDYLTHCHKNGIPTELNAKFMITD